MRIVKAEFLLKLKVETEFNNSSIIYSIISTDVLLGTSMCFKCVLTQDNLWESTQQHISQ